MKNGASWCGCGCDKKEDFDWLRDNGVDFVQGQFIEPPIALGNATTGTFRVLLP